MSQATPEPTVLGSRSAFKGRLIDLRVDTVLTSRGNRAEWEIIEHPGAVGIVALDAAGHVLLVRQYRHAVGVATLEIPAGTLGPGEDPLDCAKRELREETGHDAADWRLLNTFCPTPGYCTERIWLYLATGATPSTEVAELDADEDITGTRLSLEAALDAVARGEIIDGKTLIGLLLADRVRRDG